MTLSKRLETIYKMVPKSIVADIGADHGKLIISLVKNEIASFGYAVENKKGPYSRLCKAIEQSGLKDKITPLFSDGIKDIPSSVETLIIAGMGGYNVINILKANPKKVEKINTIIVDAHNAIKEMREQICEMGFVIADEQIVYEDNIYYEIIKFIRADTAFYSDIDFEFGPILRQNKSSLFKQKHKSRILKINEILSSKQIPQERIEHLNKEKERIISVLWTQEVSY